MSQEVNPQVQPDQGDPKPPKKPRICTDTDDDGFIIHVTGVPLQENNPNTVGTIKWCQYCMSVFMDIDKRWSV